MPLIAELKRRKVFKVGAAYLVVAWLAVQAVSIGLPAFDAPPWVLRVFILFALLGFPAVLLMSWAFEVTPQGVKADAAAPGTKRVFASAAGLGVLALGWYFYGQPAIRGEAPHTVPTIEAAATPAIPAKSVAVLAFVDMSPAHDQEYFSDGIAEEILNALAQVKDLKVAGRSSSFHYKGHNEDLRAIGKALGVAHVLEGSVRSQGNRVRITAQLIRTADDFHVWSRTYDGELTDVFELQERIARSITDELQAALEEKQKTRLVKATTSSPEAYALYLQASDIFNRRDGKRMPEAIAKLEQAIKLDPAFARAHSRLAVVYAIFTVYRPRETDAFQAAARREANRAIALDATLAEPHAALGRIFGEQRRYIDERLAFTRAIALDPNDENTNFWFAASLINNGYTKQGVQMLDRVLAIDPLLPNALSWRGSAAFYAGDFEQGERLMRLAGENGLAHAGLQLSMATARRGDANQAARQLADGLRILDTGMPAGAPQILAAGVHGDAKARARALSLIDDYLASEPVPVSGAVPNVLLKLGEPSLALRAIQDRPSANDAMFFPLLWSPYGRDARRLPEFSAAGEPRKTRA
jgi:TolB-like protein/cytochrome c-type biogenesis protein CcmH/NrfG